jgi:hypothetical protein
MAKKEVFDAVGKIAPAVGLVIPDEDAATE